MLLVIDRKETSLSLESSCLVVRINDVRHSTVPTELLTHLIIARKITLSSSLLAQLADKGVSITVFGGRNMQHAASVYGHKGTLASTRRAQYEASFDEQFSLLICRLLISAKTRYQQRFIRRLVDACPAHRYVLSKSYKQLSNSRLKLGNAQTIDSIRGIEGSNAAAVFNALAHVLPPRFAFQHRQRRPPPDPVNALLSLTYTIMHHTAIRSCHIAGLDPLCGYLHKATHGRESLAADAIELLRPAAEEFVWHYLRNETLRLEHFTVKDEACLLGKKGRSIYYSLIAEHKPAWETSLNRALYRLRLWLEREASLP